MNVAGEEAGNETAIADDSHKKTKQTKRMALMLVQQSGPRMAVGDTEVELFAAVIHLHVPSENTPGCRSRDARDKLTQIS